MMLEKEARVNSDFIESRASRYKEREIVKRSPVSLEHCCVCNHADSPSLMAHVGDGVYKCRKCLGI